MIRAVAFLAVLLSVIFRAHAPAQAERRVALVIGNGAYENAARLPNPRNDAEDAAAALRRTGFETIVGLDLTQAQMQEMAIRFSRAARKADVALFYYSGHAMQFAGVNYLMPVDAKLKDEADLRRMARVDEIVADLQRAKNLRILVLDACRDNPLAEELKRSIGRTRAASLYRGLARIESPEGMIVAFSTQAGRTADDGTGRNSPYTTAFLKHIETQQEIGLVFRSISEDVYQTTNHRQLPELSLSLIGRFYLRGKPAVAAPDTTVALPQSPAAKAWELVKETQDEAVLEAFLKEHTEGLYAALARARLKRLTEKKVAIGVYPEKPEAKRTFKPGDEFRDCNVCPNMVVVPAGQFVMGSPESEPGRLQNTEGPQHRVTIAKPFAVGKFEVTFAEWDACVLAGGCSHRPGDEGWGRGQRPVINVSWYNAKAYVKWLSRKTGKEYRLLSEAEWEYAARAGTTTPYHTGKTITTNQANFNGNFSLYGLPKGQYRKKTVPVGSFDANAFGLHDMHGNVFELVEDCFYDSYLGAPSDGSARTTGKCAGRVSRGGSWINDPTILRSAVQAKDTPNNPNSITGFRVARTLSDAELGR